jgi:hypothetical protein
MFKVNQMHLKQVQLLKLLELKKTILSKYGYLFCYEKGYFASELQIDINN